MASSSSQDPTIDSSIVDENPTASSSSQDPTIDSSIVDKNPTASSSSQNPTIESSIVDENPTASFRYVTFDSSLYDMDPTVCPLQTPPLYVPITDRLADPLSNRMEGLQISAGAGPSQRPAPPDRKVGAGPSNRLKSLVGTDPKQFRKTLNMSLSMRKQKEPDDSMAIYRRRVESDERHVQYIRLRTKVECKLFQKN